VSWVLDWINIWNMNDALLWQMDVLNFKFYIRICCADKNLNRLFWLQHKSCTERCRYIYPSVHKFESFLSKNIFQKFLCDPENEYFQVLILQYLGRCKQKLTILVRTSFCAVFSLDPRTYELINEIMHLRVLTCLSPFSPVLPYLGPEIFLVDNLLW